MRISDWSSDVCSSDLRRREGDRQSAHAPDTVERPPRRRSGSSRVLDALRNQMQTFVDLRARDVLTEAHMHAETERHVPVFPGTRSEEHTSEPQSLMRISYAVFCFEKKRLK